MLSFSIGPLALPARPLLLLIAFGLAVLAGSLAAKRQGRNPESALFALLLFGLLVARVGFVLRYQQQYQSNWWQALDVRDGGFWLWPALLAVLLGAVALAWRKPALRWTLGLALGTGMVTGLTGLALIRHLELQQPLPNETLYSLAGQPASLSQFHGKPLVVNYWASWCPPCRREMPVLAEAQQYYPDVQFVFVNQGEDLMTVANYLQQQKLNLQHVLLAPKGASAVPMTLFFDASGKLADSHLGSLSAATLAHYLQQIKSDRSMK